MLPFLELLDTEEEKEKLMLLYECFRHSLYEAAYYKVKQTELAEDMVHDTFMALTKHINKISERSYSFLKNYCNAKKKDSTITIRQYAETINCNDHIRAWGYIITILNNKIADHYRNKNTKSVVYIADYDEKSLTKTNEEPLSIVQKEEIKILLREALQSMDSPYKDAIYLKYFEKMSIKDIASSIDKSEDNTKKILERGRKMLRYKLQEGGYHGL